MKNIKKHSLKNLREDKVDFIEKNLLNQTKELLKEKLPNFPEYTNVKVFGVEPTIRVLDGDDKPGFWSHTDGEVVLYTELSNHEIYSNNSTLENKEMSNKLWDHFEFLLDNLKQETFGMFYDELKKINPEIKSADDLDISMMYANESYAEILEYFEDKENEVFLEDDYNVAIHVKFRKDFKRENKGNGKDFECYIHSDFEDNYGRVLVNGFEGEFYFDETDNIDDILRQISDLLDKAIDGVK